LAVATLQGAESRRVGTIIPLTPFPSVDSTGPGQEGGQELCLRDALRLPAPTSRGTTWIPRMYASCTSRPDALRRSPRASTAGRIPTEAWDMPPGPRQSSQSRAWIMMPLASAALSGAVLDPAPATVATASPPSAFTTRVTICPLSSRDPMSASPRESASRCFATSTASAGICSQEAPTTSRASCSMGRWLERDTRLSAVSPGIPHLP